MPLDDGRPLKAARQYVAVDDAGNVRSDPGPRDEVQAIVRMYNAARAPSEPYLSIGQAPDGWKGSCECQYDKDLRTRISTHGACRVHNANRQL